MGLFGKKKEEKASAEPAKAEAASDAKIRVLGGGCNKCNELHENTKAALLELGMDEAIDYVTDFAKVASYGVMTIPALMIGGKVVSAGKVLKKNEVVELLKKHSA